ncbi:MAG: acyl-CoA mutase large subunit family protein [Rikenellaceae bacterium]|jgi:methylmalonyl-CoA mutase|nr:acyl-CoA mutase large subunit family protein [Rikenellaceae bacterium]
MAKQNREKLFAEFPPVATEQWEKVIEADLKGADYQKKLVWRTAEGFSVRPYYRAEDLKQIAFADSASGEFPFVRGVKKCNGWKVHQTIDVLSAGEANRQALNALAAGVESLGLSILTPEFTAADLDALLDGIDIAATELVFCGPEVVKVAELAVEKAKGVEEAKMSFIIDPIINGLSLRGATALPSIDDRIADIVALVGKGGKKMRFAAVGGHHIHNSGAAITQELAFALAAGHDYLVKLTEAGLAVDEAARTIRFSLAVGANYFMEIAKMRAARMLWANIVAQYNPNRGCAAKMRIHAVTSRWNISAYDQYVNMLRGATEAMSATVGGVHSLEVTPFDAAYGKPTDFSSRIARNVQLLLKNESHFDRVADPAGGSYYIENLTAAIAESAWNLFKEVESRGGYIEAFKAGFIQDAVEASAAKRDMNIATRREILVGTNQYPNFEEKAAKEVDFHTIGVRAACGCGCERSSLRVLKPYRGALAFEELRLQVDRSGRNPRAFMLTCGSLAMARARAQFSSNFFACAGIRIIDNNFFASVEEGCRAALESGAEIVVVCASDDDYAAAAPQVRQIVGDRAIVVVAGAPACQSELEAQGIKNFISVRSNLLETLREYVRMLNI